MDDVTAGQVPPMRASDSDRAATVHRLQDAVAQGRLTPDEGSERMAAAFAAVHLHDLREPPLGDGVLQPVHRGRPRRHPPPLRRRRRAGGRWVSWPGSRCARR
jgi:hypothetical protein